MFPKWENGVSTRPEDFSFDPERDRLERLAEERRALREKMRNRRKEERKKKRDAEKKEAKEEARQKKLAQVCDFGCQWSTSIITSKMNK